MCRKVKTPFAVSYALAFSPLFFYLTMKDGQAQGVSAASCVLMVTVQSCTIVLKSDIKPDRSSPLHLAAQRSNQSLWTAGLGRV